jgi:hypothetical protein
MTEQEWLECDVVGRLLASVQGRTSGRKLRLLAVACALRVLPLTRDEWTRYAVNLALRYAEGDLPDGPPGDVYEGYAAECDCIGEPGLYHSLHPDPFQAAYRMAECAAAHQGPATAQRGSPSGLADLARDIFGNPFRPVPLDLAWRTPTVVQLAHAASDEDHLDPARLAVLSDALEDAGCTDTNLLTHLRSAGPHVRGCWALDLILGKQ